jgi:hypothetical protein
MKFNKDEFIIYLLLRCFVFFMIIIINSINNLQERYLVKLIL